MQQRGRRAADVDALWDRYFEDRDVATRNLLVEHYLPLVTHAIDRMKTFLAGHADRDDLESYGTFGLIEAVESFDPGVSGNFSGFAWKRIKGEVFDQLRQYDEVQRSLRESRRRILTAEIDLTTTLQRHPTEAEIAEHLGTTTDRLAELRSVLTVTAMPLSIDYTQVHQAEPGYDSTTLPETISGADGNPADDYEIDELREVVASAWNSLPTGEQQVLHLRYVQGLTLAKIGESLGVKTTRASQVLTSALRELRARIGAQ